DADAQAHAKVILELVRLAGEAMGDSARSQRLRILSQDGDKVFVRIALMQEHRLAHPSCDLELTCKCGALHVARGEIAEVVEAALADGYDFRPVREPFELMRQLVGELRSVMRVNARGRIKRPRMRVRKRDSLS